MCNGKGFMRWRLLTTKLQRKMNRNIKNKTMNEGHSEPSHKADVMRCAFGFTLYDSLRDKNLNINVEKTREYLISPNVFNERYKRIELTPELLDKYTYKRNYENEQVIEFTFLFTDKVEITYIKEKNMFIIFWSGKKFREIKYLDELERFFNTLLL